MSSLLFGDTSRLAFEVAGRLVQYLNGLCHHSGKCRQLCESAQVGEIVTVFVTDFCAAIVHIYPAQIYIRRCCSLAASPTRHYITTFSSYRHGPSYMPV
jgi:hypothetical protein